ncbi:Ribose-phosphate pyrophosphokinase [Frankliniella fusca]|uniref:Ribose-phosphate pyrophosphokinase n=1 Tax=Frankliniella fusca TaxID=407009 RepID=A0AAE1HP47_9NEOP|nr:Ribose-phosphate pyrophosphokinase [Frankliniella fusca]
MMPAINVWHPQPLLRGRKTFTQCLYRSKSTVLNLTLKAGESSLLLIFTHYFAVQT